MAVARAQFLAISKRLFSSASSISHQINDKFSFLNTAIESPWPVEDNSHNRWLVFFKRSHLKGATDDEKMDFYLKTAAQIVGSEDEAKERMYKFTRDCSLCGFGFEMGANVACKFRKLHSVDSLDLDLDGTGVMYMNGERVEWCMIPKSREIGRFPLPKYILENDDGPYD